MSDDLDRLLAGLDGLAEEPAPPPGVLPSGPAGTTGASPSPGAGGPPPRPPRSKRRAPTGRTDFPDLFGEPSPARGASGADAKVEMLRQRLKTTEAKLGEVRNAWQVRTAEMDALEGELAEAQRRNEELEGRGASLEIELAAERKKVAALERFIDAKKSEIDAYSVQVRRAFVEQKRVMDELHAKLAEEQRRAGSGAREELEATFKALDDVIRQRDTMVVGLQGELAAQEAEKERLHMALRAERAQRGMEPGTGDEGDVSRLRLALRAEHGKVEALEAKVEDLMRVVETLRDAIRALRARS